MHTRANSSRGTATEGWNGSYVACTKLFRDIAGRSSVQLIDLSANQMQNLEVQSSSILLSTSFNLGCTCQLRLLADGLVASSKSSTSAIYQAGARSVPMNRLRSEHDYYLSFGVLLRRPYGQTPSLNPKQANNFSIWTSCQYDIVYAPPLKIQKPRSQFKPDQTHTQTPRKRRLNFPKSMTLGVVPCLNHDLLGKRLSIGLLPLLSALLWAHRIYWRILHMGLSSMSGMYMGRR